MATHAQDVRRRVPPPFVQPPKERVPGRGRFTSVLLAVGAILLILASGILAVIFYTQTTEGAADSATNAMPGEILRPMVDLSE